MWIWIQNRLYLQVKKGEVMESNDLKIGVFLCHCGGNISDIIDLERVKESVDVDVIAEFTNLCSIKGRKIIRDNIISC